MSITKEDFEWRMETSKKLYDAKMITEEEFSAGIKKLYAMLTAEPNDKESSSGTRTANDVLKLNEEYTLHPWKRLKDQADALASDYETPMGTPEEEREFFRKLFLNKARNGLLSPMDSMVCQYHLFGNNEEVARRVLLSIILRVKPENRVLFHNWYVAQSWDKMTLSSIGETIPTMPVPLFPKELDELNEKIFLMNAKLNGGGTGGKRKHSKEDLASAYASVFRTTQDETLLGGDYIVPVRSMDGSQVVGTADMTEVESAFMHIQRVMQELMNSSRNTENTGRRKQRESTTQRESRPPSAPPRRSSSARSASTSFARPARPAWRGGGDTEGDHDDYDATQDAKNSSGLHRA